MNKNMSFISYQKIKNSTQFISAIFLNLLLLYNQSFFISLKLIKYNLFIIIS